MNTIEIKATANATRKWRLREHHGWTTLVDVYGTRAEFEAVVEEAIASVAESSSDSPSLFTRADFLDCDYYESQFASLKPETTHIVAKSADNIKQFTDEAEADKALAVAMLEYGYERLTCDRGGHAGETEKTFITDICVTITAPSGVYQFEFATAESELPSNEDLEDKGIPAAEMEAVTQAIEMVLADIDSE